MALSLLNRPELLILDEPTTGLDPAVRLALWSRVRELRRDGATVLLTTHYMDEAQRLCDIVAIMSAGNIIAQGTPDELIERYLAPQAVEFDATPVQEHVLLRGFGESFPRYRAGSRTMIYLEDADPLVSRIRETPELDMRAVAVRSTNLEDVFLTLTGARLEVNVHVVTGNVSTTQNIVSCVNKSGVRVVETVLEQLAAAEAVLTSDEKELGVALVDVGGGTTDFAVYERGSLWQTGAVMIGGDQFTTEIAVGLRMPIPDAEKTKRRSGSALTTLEDEEQTIEVASVGGRQPRIIARRLLAGVLQPTAEEIFHKLWDEVRGAGFESSLHSGIVLTGGGAGLDGLPEIADQTVSYTHLTLPTILLV